MKKRKRGPPRLFVAEILYAHEDNFTKRVALRTRATEFIGSINSNGETGDAFRHSRKTRIHVRA